MVPGSERPNVKRRCHIILFGPDVFINSGLEQSPVPFSFKVFTSVPFFSDLAARLLSLLQTGRRPALHLAVAGLWQQRRLLSTEKHVHRWDTFHTPWAKCFMCLALSSLLDSVMRRH